MNGEISSWLGLRAMAGGMLACVLGTAMAAPAQCPANLPEPREVDAGVERCNPVGAYYEQLARGAAADWKNVRACADKEQNDAVLMMLHANGFGIPRNIDRAIGHACRVSGAPAEMAGRIEHLLAIQGGKDARRFDLCDDITSGYMGGFCARLGEDAKGKQRGGDFSAVEQGLTAPQRLRYTALRKATAAFGDSVAREETDLSGTLRAALSIAAKAEVEDQLLADLRAAERGVLPKGPARDFTRADAALNAVYRKVMALPVNAKGEIDYGTVTKRGIRTTQRLWITYRDAWVAYAQARYPAVPAAAWKTRLTDRRTTSLKAWLK